MESPNVPTDYQPKPTEAVRREWARRIEAEYTSAAHTAELCTWLIRLGAPRELIDDGLRIVSDGLDHAEHSAQVCEAAGERIAPVLGRDRLELARTGGTLSEDCLCACLEVFCLGETVAVPLFLALRRNCTIPVARQALDRIVKDEVRHRQFGWDLLDYLLLREPASRRTVERHLPGALKRLDQRYGRALPGDASAAERAWGLMAPRDYATILRDTIEDEYRPRFAEHGIPLPW